MWDFDPNQCQKNAINHSFGFGWKGFGTDTDTETRYWFRLPIPIPNFGRTLLHTLQIFIFFISEPYVEAVPTVLILLALAFKEQRLFLGSETNFLGIRKTAMFITTFSISVFSGAFGMAKFLKLGPCQIVPSQAMHCGFFHVFMSMAAALIAKGCVLAFSLADKGPYETFSYPTICLIWISSCILPQLILVSIKTNL